VLALAGSGTALATGLGAIPVWRLGRHAARLRPALWGLTVGLMGVAAVVGLLLPALDDGSSVAVGAGLSAGVLFLIGSRRWLHAREDVHVGELRGADLRRAVLVFGVLFVHSLPEGLAIGTAFASETEGLGLFVILAIALQNVPEGTSVAIPMEAAGFGHRDQFWGAVATSAPQPLGALLAYALVEQVDGLLSFSFAFAAGAMLALVLLELVPQALVRPDGRPLALAGAVVGGGLMLVLAAVLGVEADSGALGLRRQGLLAMARGQIGANDGAGARLRLDRQRPLDEVDPLAHPDQSKATCCARRIEAAAVVAYLDPQSPVDLCEVDLDARSVGVLADVRERLLHEPVGGALELRRQTRRVPAGLEGEIDSRLYLKALLRAGSL